MCVIYNNGVPRWDEKNSKRKVFFIHIPPVFLNFLSRRPLLTSLLSLVVTSMDGPPLHALFPNPSVFLSRKIACSSPRETPIPSFPALCLFADRRGRARSPISLLSRLARLDSALGSFSLPKSSSLKRLRLRPSHLIDGMEGVRLKPVQIFYH